MSDHESFAPAMIKRIRKKKGLTQEEMAHQLGVSFTSVNRWENGQTKPSKLAKRQILALSAEAEQTTLDRG